MPLTQFFENMGLPTTQEGMSALLKEQAAQRAKNLANLQANDPVAYLQKQILGQNLSSQWQGEGFGSAEANAQNMAEILAGLGINDIKQFGEIPQYEQLKTQYSYNGNEVTKNSDGSFSANVPEYNYDGDVVSYKQVPISAQDVHTQYVRESYQDDGSGSGNMFSAFSPVDQSKVVMQNGQPVIQTGTAYGNKVTGQTVPNTYGERQTGNAWGGTYAGEDNTGYRVQFGPDGTPYFYTTGQSSNSLVGLLADNPILNVAANVAAAAFGGPLGVAALQAAQGKDIEDVLKAAALTYVGGQAGNYVSGEVTNALNAASGVEPGFENFTSSAGSAAPYNQAAINSAVGKTVGGATGSYVASGGNIDPLAALAGSAINTGVNAVAQQVPGYNDLPAAAKTFVNSAISSTLQNGGNLSDQALLSAAVSAGTVAARQFIADQRIANANATTVMTPEQAAVGADKFATDFAQYLPPDQQYTAAQANNHGYYDEISGKFIYDPSGPLLAPLTNATSGTGTVGDYTNVITSDDGSKLIMDKDGNVIGSTPATDQIVTNGAAIEAAAGVSPSSTASTSSPRTTNTSAAPITAVTGTRPSSSSTTNTAALTAAAAALASGSAGQYSSAPVASSSQYTPSDVELMEEIFGTNLFTTVPKAKTAKAATGGSVDDLLKLLRS